MPIFIRHVHIAAMIEKNLDDVGTSELGSPVNWFSSGEIPCVKRSTGLDQRFGDCRIWRPEQRRITPPARPFNIRAGFNKESNEIEVRAVNSDMQRATAHVTRCFSRFGLTREYLLQALDIAVARSSQDFQPAIQFIVEGVVRGLLCPDIYPSPGHVTTSCSR